MRLLFFPLILIFAACSENAPTAPVQEPSDTAAVVSETERLNAWLDEQYEEQLDFSPQTRSVLGDKTDYDQLNDASLDATDEILGWRRQSVAAMQSEFDYEALTEDGKLSWDMWSMHWSRRKMLILFGTTATYLVAVARRPACQVS